MEERRGEIMRWRGEEDDWEISWNNFIDLCTRYKNSVITIQFDSMLNNEYMQL